MQFGPYIWPNREKSYIGVGEHDGDVRFLTGSRNMAVSSMRNKNMQFGPYLYSRIAEIPSSLYRKSGSKNTMVTSDF